MAGGKMKTIGNAYWYDPNIGAINSSGFSGLPGGSRDGNVGNGSFGDIWKITIFWSASQLDANDAWYRQLYYGNGNVYRNVNSVYGNKSVGASVRCLRD